MVLREVQGYISVVGHCGEMVICVCVKFWRNKFDNSKKKKKKIPMTFPSKRDQQWISTKVLVIF